MSFMIGKANDIINIEMERREAKEKGVKIKTRPIDPTPIVYKMKGNIVTVEKTSPSTSG